MSDIAVVREALDYSEDDRSFHAAIDALARLEARLEAAEGALIPARDLIAEHAAEDGGYAAVLEVIDAWLASTEGEGR